ncbi:uncharacterized protein I206_105879 [Kwoniella pini CBS 10737]|uniref:Uncharacterized protein n=1 Tax=Kwoniella pini CBS 10737 TaxID=1296096 RepID=A0A1B9I0F1_9TREE|nr:uncharacterized protein I206_04699 [Kwoniella pini CBS 10737]OCF49012.1 hypothetical protein I206_04699 [Kwoniella pini CBS 10737]
MEGQAIHSHSPLNLAAANDIPSFVIDPSLEASSEFFQDPVVDIDHHHHHADVDEHSQNLNQGDQLRDNTHQIIDSEGNDHNNQPTQEDIDAVIKASLDHAQAQAAADAVVAAVSRLNDSIDPSLADSGEQLENQNDGKSQIDQKFSNTEPGQEHNPIHEPPLHIAPFSRPSRSIEDTPLPLYLHFGSKNHFLRWLDAESSWCHFVQRRTTTPDKRSAERLQARMRAHQRSLNAMTPEEREAATPLKTRRRKRVSPVFEKVTFTCHHAGTYESKHSTSLPEEKLRKNTKKSVKCACASRVVLSELQTGDCKVVYHWKHEGHDPFSDADLEGGRLPKSIDTWLNKQIEAGKTLDDIRKVLNISEEDKEAYLAKVSADPTALEPNMPPPLALALKVKYPDIYNRYRKLRGPVKEHKQLKGSTKRTASGTIKAGSRVDGEESDAGPSGSTTPIPTEGDIHTLGDLDPLMSHTSSVNEHLGGLTNSLIPPYTNNHENKLDQNGMIIDDDEHNEVDTEFAQLASSHDLLNSHEHGQNGENEVVVVDDLINSHEGLARALLDLPSAGLRDEDGNEMSLEEAMRRMAEGVAQVAAQEQEQEQEEERGQKQELHDED